MGKTRTELAAAPVSPAVPRWSLEFEAIVSSPTVLDYPTLSGTDPRWHDFAERRMVEGTRRSMYDP
jgi:hypothetical protein